MSTFVAQPPNRPAESGGPASETTRTTFRCECWRATASGVIETAGTTFLLLIAVRFYEAGAVAKALVAGSGSLGFLFAPGIVSHVESSRLPVARAAMRLFMVCSASFLVMALWPAVSVFVAGSIIALTCSSAAVPLFTQLYQENYPPAQRGRRFSRTIMIRIAMAALFSELAGRALSGHIGQFRWLLVIFAGAAAFAALCLYRCPSQPLHLSGGKHPYRALKFVWHDRIFRQTLICWMFMGFATLMMAPLRVEYLANPKYGWTHNGLPLTAAMVALMTGVIPNIARLILSPVWGWLFDRMNFFVLRITLNFGFAIGIFAFFASNTMTGLVIGSIVYGISNAGGDVAWNLWVTKFAPPHRVADYMSAHAFFTGIRSFVAPIVAFQLISKVSLFTMGWLSVGLILIGTAFLFPEIRFGRSPQAAAALIED